MRFYSRLLLCLPLVIAIPVTNVQAQRGALIEDLFRTVADAQLQREQQKRVERVRQLQPPPAAPSRGIQRIPLPPNQGRRGDGPKSIFDATHEFYDHAKDLHEAVHQREPLSRLQQQAEQMLDGWQQLITDLGDIQSHGLSNNRAESLRRTHQNLAPIVAQIAAALVQR